MEISTREKTLQIVSRYVIITLSISIMTIGVYFFKFPNNFVFGLSLIHISEPTRP